MDFRSLVAATVAACCVLATPGISEEVSTDNLVISDGFSRASPKMAKAGVGFMTITSKGDADRLVSFTSPACNRPELHTHIHDNGVMRMREVEAIDVPAGGSVKLEPGSFHLMCIDLKGQLVEGEMMDATLTFEAGGEITVSLPIKGPGAMGKMN